MHYFLRPSIHSQFFSLFWSFFYFKCVLPFLQRFWRSPCCSLSVIQNLLQLLLRPLGFLLNVYYLFCCNLIILLKHILTQSIQNQHQMTNFLLFLLFFHVCIFSCILVHLSSSLHRLLNMIYAQSTSIPSSTFMNVSAFLLFM
jgi:hypothetical protein